MSWASEKSIKSDIPNARDRETVLRLLMQSINLAALIAPNAWSVTDYGDGFRLNVGQVETLTFIGGQLIVMLAADAGSPALRGMALERGRYRSVGAPHSRYHGSPKEWVKSEELLTPLHDKYIRLAALSPSGKPRAGTPHVPSHNQALVDAVARLIDVAAPTRQRPVTEHYVAYHNEDTWGPWKGYGSFYTAKAFKPETLVGNRLWGVLGSGSPRTYRIATSGIITSLSDWERPAKWRTKERPSGKQIIFKNDLAAPIDVTNEPWFKSLARQQAHFSHGLNRITDSDVISSLQGLLDDTGAQTTYAEELPSGMEGAAKTVFVNRYERDERARARCIEHYGPTCSACGLDFEQFYGVIGRGYIHVHHRRPLSEIGKRYKVDPIKDLVPVCPNCHAMLHQPPGVRSIDQLKRIIEETPGKRAPPPRPSRHKRVEGN